MHSFGGDVGKPQHIGYINGEHYVILKCVFCTLDVYVS